MENINITLTLEEKITILCALREAREDCYSYARESVGAEKERYVSEASRIASLISKVRSTL